MRPIQTPAITAARDQKKKIKKRTKITMKMRVDSIERQLMFFPAVEIVRTRLGIRMEKINN
jgi:hypothetical protein